MTLDIARQPFVPAFLTTLTLAIVCVNATSFADVPCAAFSAAGIADTIPAEGLAIGMPSALICAFQTAFPGWSKLIAVFAFLFTSVSVGRQAIRYNLYKVSTCISIPLVAILACLVGLEGLSLQGILSMTFLAYFMKNFARSFRSGYTFDAVFRTGLYMGALICLTPATLPLLLIMPFGLLLFRRTLREVVVALAGLLVLPLALSYVNWAMGGDLTAPIRTLGHLFWQGSPLAMLLSFSHLQWGALAIVGLLSLAAIQIFLSNLYAVGTKPRFILIFNTGVFLLSILLAAAPAATPDQLLLMAPPAAMLMPCFLIRVSRSLSTSIYLLLLVLAAVRIILQ